MSNPEFSRPVDELSEHMHETMRAVLAPHMDPETGSIDMDGPAAEAVFKAQLPFLAEGIPVERTVASAVIASVTLQKEFNRAMYPGEQQL